VPTGCFVLGADREAPGSAASQAAWVAHTDQAAVDRDALFYVHAFLRDYPPIGTWIAEQGILAPELQSLLNTWPCSGLQDPSGAWRPERLAIGLPEPTFGASVGLGVVGLLGLVSGRSRRRRREESPVRMAITEETGYTASVGSMTRSRPVDANTKS
jgi:hypothetical protein